jgi:hypothetical protein
MSATISSGGRLATLAFVAACAGGFAAGASAETIVLRSGQVGGFPGLVGQFDSTMRFGSTVSTGPLSPNPFVAADYNASASGSAALIITPYTSWLPALTFDPQARWVGTGDSGIMPAPTIWGASSSALYCVPFTVTTTGITSATISLSWACDDGLGDFLWGGANPIGAYLRDSFGNVTPITPAVGGNYGVETQVINFNILGAISTGSNELFLYQRDQGAGISGLIFGAELRITPTPGAAALLGLGGLLGMRRRR